MPLVGLCAGYELSTWRAKQLAENIFEWLPFVALDQSHQLSFAAHNFLELLQIACKHVYETHKRENRGELGEVLLHIACVEQFAAFPVLCKLTLKTAPNDTVKGFDGIYVVPKGEDFEIWLGESKLYRNAARAIKDAVKSVKTHILPDFLTAEKAMVTTHVDKTAPFYAELKRILKKKTSADELLKRAVFPVLISYDSQASASHSSVTDAYIEDLDAELSKLQAYFEKRSKGLSLRFCLIFVPLSTKKLVVDEFDKLLRPFV